MGWMWSGGTGFLFQEQPYPDGSDRVPHVLCGRDHDGTHDCQRQFCEIHPYPEGPSISFSEAFLLWDHRADADALDILCIDRSRECSGRNRDTIYLSCHRDPMDILQEGRLPGTAEAASVILAIGGVFLLVTGGNLDRIMVPADCIWLGLASAVFLQYALCILKT